MRGQALPSALARYAIEQDVEAAPERAAPLPTRDGPAWRRAGPRADGRPLLPLWLSLPTIGSGRAVQTYRKTHPEILGTLGLFDAATAATRIAVPMLVAVARFDPAVAPPCQFSIANALMTSSDHETVILDAGHVDYPGAGAQHALLARKVERLFGVA